MSAIFIYKRAQIASFAFLIIFLQKFLLPLEFSAFLLVPLKFKHHIDGVSHELNTLFQILYNR